MMLSSEMEDLIKKLINLEEGLDEICFIHTFS